MSKKITFSLGLLLAFWTIQSCATSRQATTAKNFEYSTEVNTIVQGKCYGCHSEDGRSDKAKAALMWDKVPTMSADEQEHILEEIMEVTAERKMPPPPMVERNPDLKLTDAEIATFQAWAQDMKKVVEKKQ